MKRLILAFLFVLHTGLCVAQSDSVAVAIAHEISPLLAKHKVPGLAVAVVAKGKLLWQGGIGVVEVGTSARITDTTRFQIASISKPITALTMLRLAKQGKLNLDEDVNVGLSS